MANQEKRNVLIFTDIDDNLRDVSSHRIVVREDGVADLSQVPKDFELVWTKYGLSGQNNKHAFPADGELFCEILLERSNPYFRVRRV